MRIEPVTFGLQIMGCVLQQGEEIEMLWAFFYRQHSPQCLGGTPRSKGQPECDLLGEIVGGSYGFHGLLGDFLNVLSTVGGRVLS